MNIISTKIRYKLMIMTITFQRRVYIMPLFMSETGTKVILKEINWGVKLKKKLQDMGLTPGVTMSIVSGSKRGSGAVIVDVRGTRLALGNGVVSKIIVENC